jgi:hypothetical protein
MTAVAATARTKLTLPANILAAIDDPNWWQPWFHKGDWFVWKVFLKAAFGIGSMDDSELTLFKTCTGRTTPPNKQCAEAWAIAGRRGGKSRIMSLCAAWLAGFVDWREHLAPGEVATCHVLESKTSSRCFSLHQKFVCGSSDIIQIGCARIG